MRLFLSIHLHKIKVYAWKNREKVPRFDSHAVDGKYNGQLFVLCFRSKFVEITSNVLTLLIGEVN